MKKRLIIKFHALLSQLNLKHEKQNILEGFGVDSTKDLNERELEEAIHALQRQKVAKTNRPEVSATTRKKRSTVLTILTDLEIYENKNSWPRVNEYLMRPQIAGKLLFEMTDMELDALARKLRAIYAKILKAKQLEDFYAANN